MSIDRCRYAAIYKGKREPKCGCLTCLNIWNAVETKRLLKFIDKVAKEVEKWPAWMKGKANELG